MEIFNLRNLNEVYVWEQYQIKVSNRLAALENLSNCEDVKYSLGVH